MTDSRQYLFFVREELPKPEAYLIQVIQCANAAANLGYSTWLAHLQRGLGAVNPWRWIMPLQPRSPNDRFAEFYNTQSQLQLLPLAMPWPIDHIQHKLTNASTVACKYYWPVFLRHSTRLVHTRDWNFVKAAIRAGRPVIYECHHFLKTPYDPEVVNSPLLQVAVTVIDTVKNNMLGNGMPEEKIMVIPNGFNRRFLERHLAAATGWRQRLLQGRYDQLVVYAGALYRFKGVDLLLDAAKKLPQVKFAIAGGPPERQRHYQDLIHHRQLDNVELLGFLAQKELAEVLQAANVLAHPHLSGDAAGFTSPLKLFDYMASGTPIAATAIPSLAGLQGSPAIAAWCPPDHVEAFVTALQNTLTAYSWRETGYSHGRDYVRQFSWENRISRILDRVEPQFRPPLAGSMT